MVAITQIRNRNTEGRALYERKLAEGKTKKEAVRVVKRRISDAIYRQLVIDAEKVGPGGQAGTALQSSVTRLNPDSRLFGEATARTRTQAYDHLPTRARLTEGTPLCR